MVTMSDAPNKIVGMTRAITFLSLFLTFVAHAASNDWSLVPGERAGPVTRGMTRAEVVKAFGAKNVVDEMLGAEATEPGWTIHKGTDREISVYTELVDASVERSGETFIEKVPVAASVGVLGKATRWRLPNGVRIGTPMKELVRLNGEPRGPGGVEGIFMSLGDRASEGD
jgi:hypothetical protein